MRGARLAVQLRIIAALDVGIRDLRHGFARQYALRKSLEKDGAVRFAPRRGDPTVLRAAPLEKGLQPRRIQL